MSDILERDLVFYDPLSEVTRKERTALLGLSMLGLALVVVPLVPEKFGAFGIEFTRVSQAAFLSLYALLLGYYLLAFLIYAFTDLIAWRRTEHIRYAAYLRASEAQRAEAQRVANASLDRLLAEPPPALHRSRENPVYRGLASYPLAVAASRLRAFFEFGLPVLFAIYVIYRLLGTGAP